jgi:hypothetical protein
LRSDRLRDRLPARESTKRRYPCDESRCRFVHGRNGSRGRAGGQTAEQVSRAPHDSHRKKSDPLSEPAASRLPWSHLGGAPADRARVIVFRSALPVQVSLRHTSRLGSSRPCSRIRHRHALALDCFFTGSTGRLFCGGRCRLLAAAAPILTPGGLAQCGRRRSAPG